MILFHPGAFEDLPPAEGIDLILADPPYGVLKAGWDQHQSAQLHLKWLERLAQWAAPHTTPCYWFGGWGKYRDRVFYRTLAELENSTPWRLVEQIYWEKKRAIGTAWGHLSACEFIARLSIDTPAPFVEKPYLNELRGYGAYNPKYQIDERKRRTWLWHDCQVGETWAVTEILRGKAHTAEKPKALWEIPINAHTRPGDWILEPFGGSASAARAAHAMGRNAIVCENDPESIALIHGILSTLREDEWEVI